METKYVQRERSAVVEEAYHYFYRGSNRNEFKEGEAHGIEFFKVCLSVLQLDGISRHIMFMPCSTETKYFRRFGHLHEYIVNYQKKNNIQSVFWEHAMKSILFKNTLGNNVCVNTKTMNHRNSLYVNPNILLQYIRDIREETI